MATTWYDELRNDHRPDPVRILARDLLIPVLHGTTWTQVRSVSPLLGSRDGLDTAEDSMGDIATKIVDLVHL